MKKSAGIILYKKEGEKYKYFLVHPGGPYFENNNKNTWSIPKGEFTTEEPIDAAIREFKEETSFDINFDGVRKITLTPIIQRSGKKVFAFAFEGDADETKIVCNEFTMEYPSGSGKIESFVEVDKAAWFTLEEAKPFINKSQYDLLVELDNHLTTRANILRNWEKSGLLDGLKGLSKSSLAKLLEAMPSHKINEE